ncbi:MAG: FkbM family methyltransferase [Nitrosopumilaceae archaeon]|nr:FkbM family methyltransferase [Nitrosopumilaceae archaeon]
MSVGIGKKIIILLKAIQTIKNWRTFIDLYFRKIKSDYTVLEMRNGIKVKLRTDSTDLMAFVNVWLVEEYKKQGFEIKDKDTIIDIGAHIGLFALYASQFCKSGKIFCFEPIKENFDVLTANVELNKIINIIAVNKAVSTENKTITIYLSEDQSGHSMHHASSKKIQVESISLQSIFDLNSIEQCNFMKMDCEGEEYQIMEALPDSHYAKIRKICMEYHLADVKQKSLDDMISRLVKLSFKTTKAEATRTMGLLYARR